MLVACPECDLLHRALRLPAGSEASGTRCGARNSTTLLNAVRALWEDRARALVQEIAAALAALAQR